VTSTSSLSLSMTTPFVPHRLLTSAWTMLMNGSLDAAVKDDIEYLRRSKLVPDDVMLSGWVYEVETGKTRRVV
jgi:carbonic anhydrase